MLIFLLLVILMFQLLLYNCYIRCGRGGWTWP